MAIFVISTNKALALEQFYLHPIHFSLHPIREMGVKTWVCVIWGVDRKNLGVNRISLSLNLGTFIRLL